MITLSAGQISVLQNLSSVGQKVGMRLFLVGGVVRDLLLFNRLDDNDFDLVVEGDGAACARELANQFGGKVKEFKDFLTAKVVNLGPSFGSIEVDFATARTEYYAKPGSLPSVQAASIEDDLKRRDFSINAMALPLELFVSGLGAGISKETLAKNLIDQFDGLGDLRAGQIKTLHDLSMIDDPTRAFRACRYAARIGGSIESVTASLIGMMIEQGGLSTISDFRKVTELKKIFSESSWLGACELLHHYKIFASMELCQSGQGEQFMESVRRINSISMLDGSARLRLTHWLAAHFLGERGEQRIHELGYSKKKAQSICSLVKEVSTAPIAHMSVEATQFAFTVETNSARLSDLKNRLGA